mgnify:CR=1 FL=1
MPSTIAVSDRLKQTIAELAARDGRSQSSVTEEAIMAGLNGTPLDVPPAPPVRQPDTLTEAATVFLRHLPEPMVDLITDLCRTENRQPAQYLLSYMKLAYDRGETAFFMPEDDLTVYFAQPHQTAPTLAPTKCEQCSAVFAPTRLGQRFCPDPDDGSISCGRQHGLDIIWRTRPRVAGKQRQAAMNGIAPS